MIHFIFFCLTFPKKKVCYALIISGMPTWRNGRRAAFRSQSAYAGEGSSPFVGTIHYSEDNSILFFSGKCSAGHVEKQFFMLFDSTAKSHDHSFEVL